MNTGSTETAQIPVRFHLAFTQRGAKLYFFENAPQGELWVDSCKRPKDFFGYADITPLSSSLNLQPDKPQDAEGHQNDQRAADLLSCN